MRYLIIEEQELLNRLEINSMNEILVNAKVIDSEKFEEMADKKYENVKNNIQRADYSIVYEQTLNDLIK